MEWETDGFQSPHQRIADCSHGIGLECGMHFELIFNDHDPKVAIMVSKLLLCLQDLLLRRQTGELKADISLILSNHEDAAEVARDFGIPFKHFPITPENRAKHKPPRLKKSKRRAPNSLFSPGYMQILSEYLVEAFPN